MATGGLDAASGTGGLGQITPALPAQDLTRDPLISNAPRITVEGALLPALGGIPLLAKLGRGGMGAVYYAVNPRLQREVAVKVLPFHIVDQDPAAIQRFFREAQSAARVRSPHLVDVFDVNQDSGIYYLVLEFVHGPSAGAYLKQVRAMNQVGLSESSALEIVIAATTGLIAAHAQGIIHRDIKPDNILVPMRSGNEQLDFAAAKLADLGLARSEESGQSLTGTAQCLGTPGYLAPEQARDAKAARKPADVFSMGATLYALLAGQAPFAGQTLMQVLTATTDTPHPPVRQRRGDVSAPTAALIDRCLAKDPAQRFPDGTALLAALQSCRAALSNDDLCVSTVTPPRVLAGAGERPRTPLPDAKPSSTMAPEPRPPFQKRKPRLARALAGTVILAAMAAGAAYYFRPPATPAPNANPGDPVVMMRKRLETLQPNATQLGPWQSAVSVEFRLGETAPAPGLTEMVEAQSEQKVYLHERMELTNADIAQADVWTIPFEHNATEHPGPADPDADGAAVGVVVTLTPAGKERLAALTKNNVGKQLCILVDHKLVSAPVIREAILDGKAQISGLFSRQEAEKIAQALGNR